MKRRLSINEASIGIFNKGVCRVVYQFEIINHIEYRYIDFTCKSLGVSFFVSYELCGSDSNYNENFKLIHYSLSNKPNLSYLIFNFIKRAGSIYGKATACRLATT